MATPATDRKMIKPAIWLVALFAIIVIAAMFVMGDGGDGETPVVATGTVTAAPGTPNPAYPDANATGAEAAATPNAQALNQNPDIQSQSPMGKRGEGSEKGVEETDG